MTEALDNEALDMLAQDQQREDAKGYDAPDVDAGRQVTVKWETTVVEYHTTEMSVKDLPAAVQDALEIWEEEHNSIEGSEVEFAELGVEFEGIADYEVTGSCIREEVEARDVTYIQENLRSEHNFSGASLGANIEASATTIVIDAHGDDLLAAVDEARTASRDGGISLPVTEPMPAVGQQWAVRAENYSKKMPYIVARGAEINSTSKGTPIRFKDYYAAARIADQLNGLFR